jgi:2-methylcitrate dehydratase PrpD
MNTADRAPAQRGEISPLMRTLSAYIAEAARRPLPEDALEATRQHLLDTLAAMISGSTLLPGRKAIEYVKTLGGTEEACVPGSRIVTNAVNASLAGGMLAHADETDDSHPRSGTHPGASTVPAALAMAERAGASGAALLRAVALGYDICVRAALALGAAEFRAKGFDVFGYAGTFGATAAAGSLAGLTADQVRYLLSYAAQQASGISDYPRDTQHIEKAFNFGGRPARSGVTGATMIAMGMTGVEDVFSGRNNFFVPFGDAVKPEELVRGLGEVYEIGQTSIKKWSVGSPAQACLDALSEVIRTQAIKAENVEKCSISTDHRGVQIVNNAAMPDICLQYLAAVMLLDGTVTFAAAHDDARMGDPRVVELRRRIEFFGEDALERTPTLRRARVTIRLRDGREVTHLEARGVRGTPQNPMTREEVGEKAFQLVAPVLGEGRARELVATVWNLEAVENVVSLRPLLMA